MHFFTMAFEAKSYLRIRQGMTKSRVKMTARESKIPDAVIERISRYSRSLETMSEGGTVMISSERLAEICGVHPAQIRKDLSYFGEFGIRGVGYNVRDLLGEIKKIFSTHREWRLAVVGIGEMGTALIRHANFAKKNYRFVAAFDSDLEKAGTRIAPGIVIEPFSRIKSLIQELGVEVGVITTQPAETHRAVDLLVDAGIKAILNCSPLQVGRLENCSVENVDLTANLEYLAYYLSRSL